uniref:Liprin-alpha n=1 Tax=Mesocestoides corti TaxID=53468 RepID=A0A5K3EIT5_MESCO
MCDVMPTIPEDAQTQYQGDHDSQLTGEGGNVEDMLLSMLDERDRLMVGLKEARAELQSVQLRLDEVEKERDDLQSQLSSTLPTDILSCTRELAATKEELARRTEEVLELKAERNNTRLLLEHLECLVSRHERSLRMTVIKRHNLTLSTIPASDDYNGNGNGGSNGISSEVEVLKALKSLFEHHKALDEKVRERLKSAITRASQLEQELADLKSYASTTEGQAAWAKASHSFLGKSDVATITDPSNDSTNREIFEVSKQCRSANSTESSQQQIADLLAHNCELEEKLASSSRELAKANNQIGQLHAELIESENKRSEQEAKIVSLDQRCLSAQREITASQNQVNKLRTELAGKSTQLKQMEEKVSRLQARLELSEQSRTEAVSTPAEGNKTEKYEEEYDFPAVAQFQQQIISQKSKINSLALQLSNAQDRIKELTEQLEDGKSELIRAHEREKLNEEHNERLSSTVDALLMEANERLQSHLSERMSALQQKRELVCEVEHLRSALDEASNDREALVNEANRLRRLLAGNKEGGPLGLPLSCPRPSSDKMDTLDTMDAMLAVDPSGRLICDHSVSAAPTSVVYSVRPSIVSSPTKPGPFVSNKAQNSNQSGLMSLKLKEARAPGGPGDPPSITVQREPNTLDKEYANIPWSVGYGQPPPIQRFNQTDAPSMTEMNASCPHAFPTNIENHQQQQHQQSHHADPQALAALILQQLEVINDEIKMIQEEKKNTDERASELRSRVTAGARGPGVEARSSFTPFETADSGIQMGCWSPTSSLQHSIHKAGSFSPESAPQQRQTAQPQPPGYGDRGKSRAPSPMAAQMLLRPRQRDYADSPPGEQFASVPPPPRRAHQPGFQVQKKHGYDAEAPQQSQHLAHMGPNEPCAQTLPSRMQTINPRDFVTGGVPIPVQSQHHRFPKDKTHVTDVTKAFNDSRPDHCEKLTGNPNEGPPPRFIKRSEDAFWSPPGIYFSQNAQTSNRSPSVSASGSTTVPQGLQQLSQRQRQLDAVDTSATQSNHQDRSLPRDIVLDPDRNRTKCCQFLNQEEKRWQKGGDLIETALRAKIPFAMWNNATVVAWLEHWVGMPAWYVAACKANITCGGMIASLSDQEVQRELGISNPLHRLKLRVATQEMMALTNSDQPDPYRVTGAPPMDLPLSQVNLNHEWVGNVWLASLGLIQYRRQFMECLVDGRMLEHLTKRDLRMHLKVVDGFHRLSIQCGIALLKRFNYDLEAIEERRVACQSRDSDMIVWTNDRVTTWLVSSGIISPNISLEQSGLHGAVIALDADMDTPSLATMLQIPNSNVKARELLEYRLFNLVKPYRSLRLSYINLDNPAFLSDDKVEEYLWGDDETGEEDEAREV